MSVVGAIVEPVSWSDWLGALGSLLSRHTKMAIGLTFALLTVFVPPARAAFVALGEAVIHDTSERLNHDLTPAMTPLMVPPGDT